MLNSFLSKIGKRDDDDVDFSDAGIARMRQTLYATVPLKDQKQDIRILTLNPGPRESDIKCTLKVTKLSSAPSFEALSHCWGDGANVKLIHINKYPLAITEDLWHALQYVRHVKSPRRMWIDALCIDQSSFGERAAQVSIMRAIFAKATLTVAWVGPAIKGSDDTLKFANALMPSKYDGLSDSDKPGNYTHWSHTFIWSDWLRRKINPVLAIEELFSEKQKNFPEKDCRGMLSQRWFSRMWILQEAAVSKKVLLKCGDSAVWLKDFLNSAPADMFMFMHGNVMNLDSKDDSYVERYVSFARLIKARKAIQAGQATPSLSSLLIRFRRFDATEAVDKLFALYGLAEKDVKALGLQPDYTAEAQKVYTDVAYAILNGLGDVSILEAPRGDGKLRQSLPSWVPDWTDISRFGEGLAPDSQRRRKLIEPSTAVGIQRYMQVTAIGDDKESQQQFCASTTSSLQFQCTRDQSDTLSISGLVFDEIANLSPSLKELWDSLAQMQQYDDDTLRKIYFKEPPAKLIFRLGSGPQEAIDDIVECYMRQVCAKGSKYPTGEARHVAYAQTLCAGSLPDYTSMLYELPLPWYLKKIISWSESSGETPVPPEFMLSKEKWLEAWSRACDVWISAKKWRQRAEKVPFEMFDPVRPLVDLFRPKANRMDSAEKTAARKFMNGLIATVASIAITAFRGFDDMFSWVFQLAVSLGPTYRRRVAETGKGYFALVPDEAMVGDKIVILKGGKLPLIIRPKGEVFELIGESYVHGTMFGEIWDESICETIRLC